MIDYLEASAIKGYVDRDLPERRSIPLAIKERLEAIEARLTELEARPIGSATIINTPAKTIEDLMQRPIAPYYPLNPESPWRITYSTNPPSYSQFTMSGTNIPSYTLKNLDYSGME